MAKMIVVEESQFDELFDIFLSNVSPRALSKSSAWGSAAHPTRPCDVSELVVNLSYQLKESLKTA